MGYNVIGVYRWILTKIVSVKVFEHWCKTLFFNDSGATEALAERLLEACGGNIDLAIGMHLDCQEDKDQSPRPEASEDDVG